MLLKKSVHRRNPAATLAAKAILATAIAVICFSSSSCGGYASSAASSSGGVSVAGTWRFTLASNRGGSMTASGSLTQTGGSATGTMNLVGSCADSGTFTASTSVYSLNATLMATNETIMVTGTVASDGNSGNGTYQITSASGACAAALNDMGTWTATRTFAAMPAGFAGSIQSADRLPISVRLDLSGQTGQVSGNASFSSSACLHSVNMAGTMSDSEIHVQGQDGDNAVALTGAMDKSGNSAAITSIVSGPCQAESGAGTLMKINP
jgi:hypothetical protein